MKEIMNKTKTKKEQSLKKIMSKYIKTNKSKIYIKTYFDTVDKLINGFYLGELVIIGGRPAMGKTTFGLNLIKNISIGSDYKVPSLFITLELNEQQLFRRLLKTYNLNKANKAQFSYELQTVDNTAMKNSQIYIADALGTNVVAIIKRCKKLIYSKGVKVVIIDFVQLIKSISEQENRDIEIAKIMVKLKKMAVKMEVVVIVTSQLSKELDVRVKTKGTGPLLCDFPDSESLSSIPDKVIFIHRPEYYHIKEDKDGKNTQGMTEIIIAKNNNGKKGTAILKFDNSNYTFK